MFFLARTLDPHDVPQGIHLCFSEHGPEKITQPFTPNKARHRLTTITTTLICSAEALAHTPSTAKLFLLCSAGSHESTQLSLTPNWLPRHMFSNVWGQFNPFSVMCYLLLKSMPLVKMHKYLYCTRYNLKNMGCHNNHSIRSSNNLSDKWRKSINSFWASWKQRHSLLCCLFQPRCRS